MVLCVVLGCSKRSGRDREVHFYRIPKVITNRGRDIKKLSKKRRACFLAAIKREGLTEKILANDRICSRHFILGKPAPPLDENNPDWLPTLHKKKVSGMKVKAAEERMERARVRESLRTKAEEETSCTNQAEISTQTKLTSSMIKDLIQSTMSQRNVRLTTVLMITVMTSHFLKRLSWEMMIV